LADLPCLLLLFSPASLDASLNDIAPGVDARDGPPGMGVDWLDEAVVDGEPGGSFGLAAIVELIGDLPVFFFLLFLSVCSAVLCVCALPQRQIPPAVRCLSRRVGSDFLVLTRAFLHRSSRASPRTFRRNLPFLRN